MQSVTELMNEVNREIHHKVKKDRRLIMLAQAEAVTKICEILFPKKEAKYHA